MIENGRFLHIVTLNETESDTLANAASNHPSFEQDHMKNTLEWWNHVIEYLKRWDDGDDSGEVYRELVCDHSDLFENDGYVVTDQLGQFTLYRRIK